MQPAAQGKPILTLEETVVPVQAETWNEANTTEVLI